MSAEQQRLDEARNQATPWKKWGPYLSERQWGTVREDYSNDGNAWAYFSHDQANKLGCAGRRLGAILNETKLRRALARVPDENEFLSPFGIRSLSRCSTATTARASAPATRPDGPE